MPMGSAAASDQQAHQDWLRAADGTRFFCRSWSVPKPWAASIIVHGLGEHSGRYLRLAGDLSAQGIAVFTMDHRGHGKSEGRRGDIRQFSDFVDDLQLLVDKTRAEMPEVPRILVGHSLGGLIALNYAAKNPPGVHAVAVSSPAIGLALKLPPLKVALARLFAKIIPTLPFPNGVDPKNLSRSPEVVAAYRADPLIERTVTARLGVELERAMAVAPQLAEKISIPCLIEHAGDDKVCSAEASQRFALLVRNAPVTFHRYDGLYHEIFNEPERERPIQDLVRWMREVTR